MSEKPTKYCGLCGYRINEGTDFVTRASGGVQLHKACAPKWDAEYEAYVASMTPLEPTCR